MFGFCDEDDMSINQPTIRISSDQENTKEASKATSVKNGSGPEGDEIDRQVENLLNFELGFSQVMEAISKSKKPIIGHNMKFDIAFMYHQFYKELPDTYAEFATSFRKDFIRHCYDTKVLTMHAGKIGKSDLQSLFRVCKKDKKYSNNLCFDSDCKGEQTQFSLFEQNGG